MGFIKTEDIQQIAMLPDLTGPKNELAEEWDGIGPKADTSSLDIIQSTPKYTIPAGKPMMGMSVGPKIITHVQSCTRNCGYQPVQGLGMGTIADTRGYTHAVA